MTEILGVPELFLNKTKLDSITQLPDYRERLPVEFAIAAINGLIWQIRQAQKTSEQALSHRNYKIGAAAIAYDPKTLRYGNFVGVNVKPTPGESSLNIHAEDMIAAKIRYYKFEQMIAMAIWGDPEDEDSNPEHSPTRRPCRRCSKRYSEIPEVSNRTLILSGNADLSVCEFYTVGELEEYWSSGGGERSINDIPTYSLRDDMNDGEYTQGIEIPYLLPKVLSLFPESSQVQMILGTS